MVPRPFLSFITQTPCWKLKLDRLALLLQISRCSTLPSGRLEHVAHIFLGTQDESCHAAAYGDAMKVELLQMATLMIRKAPQQLVQNRKEFIKFGWNNLKKDDSAVKYYAFQNVCHFFDAYAAPEKIVLQVPKLNCMSLNKLILQALLRMPHFPENLPMHSMMPHGWGAY